MKQNFKILPFSHYVVRTPLFPISFYTDLIQNYTCEKAIEIYKNPLVKEALLLASPELINELDKWSDSNVAFSDKKKSALEFTLLKYVARMSSRCTPFGLFAGCSVGKLDLKTDILLENPEKHKRFTQFDMQFWIALLQNIAARKDILFQLKYFPNSSIYKLGDFYRYIQYKFVKTNREHNITALKKSGTLKKIYKKAKTGLTIEEIVELIIDPEEEKQEAENFILQLIDLQFLVSELDASLTDNNEYFRALSIIKKTTLEKEYLFLKSLYKEKTALDKVLVTKSNQYKKIKDEIRKNGFEYNEKYLFQTDLNITTISNSLDKNIANKVSKAIRFLNTIQTHQQSTNIINFKKAFSNRYEQQEMPLTTVLDTETGLGYPYNHDMSDVHQILESFSFKSNKKEIQKEKWTLYDTNLEKKLQECLSNNQIKIELSENDFADFSNFDNAPPTFSIIIEAYNNQQICIESSGNTSAAKLLGRFCNGSSDIFELTKKIVQKENDYHSDKILAEIVHIPESRTGNILRRPVLRNYEIPYLTNPGVAKTHTIHLSDLFISIKNNNIVLRSKKLNREIIPCLSNAHNFSHNSSPIYNFLCDLNDQSYKPIYSFSWGVLESHYKYFPRIEYQGTILSKARWIILKEEISSFLKLENNELLDWFSNWRIDKKIPRYVNWVNSDNTLLLDFQTQTGIQLFLKSTQNRNKIILEEFLFTESIVKNRNGEIFSNQFILSFYKEQI